MARPQTRSDQVILERTRAVLIERGPAAPVSAIARRVGLSAPAILGRFGSRRALLHAALAPPSTAPVLLALQAAPDPQRFSQQLSSTLLVVGAWLDTALPRLMLLRMSPPADRPRPWSELDQPRLLPSVTIWLARAQARGLLPPGDAQALAAMVLDALSGHSLDRFLHPERAQVSRDRVVGQLVVLLTSGASERPGSTPSRPRDGSAGSSSDRPAGSG